MYSIIHKAREYSKQRNLVILAALDSDWSKFDLTKSELDFVSSKLSKGENSIYINQYSRSVFIEFLKEEFNESISLEKAREIGAVLVKKINKAKRKLFKMVQ